MNTQVEILIADLVQSLTVSKRRDIERAAYHRARKHVQQLRASGKACPHFYTVALVDENERVEPFCVKCRRGVVCLHIDERELRAYLKIRG
jgi:hypothetical protein